MESKIISDDGETIILRIWDTAGQERFRSISSNTIRFADACIIVFDLTNKNSFKCVENWINTIRDYSNKRIGLFGNKSDLSKREVNKEEIDSLCQKEDILYFETSALLKTGISEGFKEIANLIYKEKKEKEIKRGKKKDNIKLEPKEQKKKKQKFC